MQGFYPVFDQESDITNHISWGDEGVCLLVEIEALDEIALENGVEPLSGFADKRELSDDFDEGADEPAELLEEWDEWFSPDDGLETVEAILNAVSATPEAVAESEAILESLEVLRTVLREASSRDLQFRLEVF